MSLPATRMNLMDRRGKMSLAMDGADLLKSKREALVKDFFRIVDTILDSRDEIAMGMQRCMTLAALAKAFSGSHLMKAAALSAKREVPIDVSETNIWGIQIPEIRFRSLRRSPEARGMLPVDTPPHIIEASEAYEKLLEEVLRAASQEIRLKRLGEEIRKVSRRINALEQSLIPSLHGEIRAMSETLQEREREDLFRLKQMKNKRTRTLGR